MFYIISHERNANFNYREKKETSRLDLLPERLTVHLNAKMRKPFRAGDKTSHFRQWSFLSVRRSFKVEMYKRHLSPDLEDRSYLDTWLIKTEPHKKHL